MASKRDQIKRLIEEGGYTVEQIVEKVGCTINSFRTSLATLRLMGFCAVKGDEGTLTFVSSDEWENIKAERAEKAASKKSGGKLTPAQKYDRAVKAVARTVKAAEAALKRAEENTDEDAQELLDLRAQKATIEMQIANIVLRNTPEAYEDAPEDAPEEMPEEMPEETPEETPEELA